MKAYSLDDFAVNKATWIDISNGVILFCLRTRSALYKHTHRLTFQIDIAEYDNKEQ